MIYNRVADALAVPSRVMTMGEIRPTAFERVPATVDLNDVGTAEPTQIRLVSRRSSEGVADAPGGVDLLALSRHGASIIDHQAPM